MDLKNANVAVLGLARSGIGAARLLDEVGARVTVADRKTADELGGAVSQLNASRIKTALGSEYESALEQADLIVKQGFQITAVESGAAALEALDANSGIDMVVCDLDLADMDGFALLEEIRRRHGDDAVRVVGLSTATDRMVAARFLRAGGDEYIQKPFLEEEFNSRIFHVASIQKRIQSLHRIAARGRHEPPLDGGDVEGAECNGRGRERDPARDDAVGDHLRMRDELAPAAAANPARQRARGEQR